MTRFKAWVRAARKRLTWRNVRWFVGVNAFGWAFQLTMAFALVLCGACEVTALMSAKVTNWVVFLHQCRSKMRAE